MSDLVAIIYPSEAKAEEVRQRLFKLQKEYLITISDAVIAVKTEAGPVKLNQLVNTTAVGAVSGSFWGLLIGVVQATRPMSRDRLAKAALSWKLVTMRLSVKVRPSCAG